MTSVSTQQQMVAAVHSYSRPQPTAHNIIANSSVPNQDNEVNGTSLIVVPISKAYVKDSMIGLWKDAIPLANTFFIELDETLDLTESWTTFKQAFISTTEDLDLTDSWVAVKKKIIEWAETLDLTDSVTTFKEAVISLAETLDLTDTDSTFKKAFISLAETLDLVDTTSSFKRAIISLAETLDLTDALSSFKRAVLSLAETLDLVDVTSSFKTANRSLTETLDLIDETEAIKIPAGGPQTFFISIDETLDLTDSWQVGSVSSQVYRGGGRFFSRYTPPRETKKIKRPNFIYRFNLSEALSLFDNWHVRPIIRNKGLQSPVQETMDFTEKWDVKVIRAGRNKKLKQIKDALELLDFLDEFDTTGLAEDVRRINVNLTKTNRLTKSVESDLAKELERNLNKILAEYKEAKGFISSDNLKNKHKQEIEDIIRSAVQESYILATNYVGKVFKKQKIFLTQQDLSNIKIEANKISDSFWRQTDKNIRAYQLEENMKINPIPILSAKEPLKQLGTIASLIAGISTFGVLAKATLSKLQQIPKDDISKQRIIVFTTENDEDVCPICAQYEGVEYYENDPFIIKPIDDTHLNCRCRLLIKDTDSELVVG